ncbi:MAG: SO_0444 family Cu/Zn efflux transporter [Desulfobacterota bacterium]|nr:SO_0444 family Cu/Zn efflux transporter [Thermodesulfobacteriota bacterium]
MLDTVFGIFTESWQVLNAFAMYCLIGLCMSGLLKSMMPDSFVERHLGGNNFRSVIKAALLGIPLPLCSCGVIPVATGLRRQGAGNGPTTAFLIATPETGVDSIAITYALLDPIMTIIRPVAAFLTAMTAGAIVTLMPEGKHRSTNAEPSCSCCSHPADQLRPCCNQVAPQNRIANGLRFAFNSLLAEIGPPLLFGVIIAGAISYFLPPGSIERYLGSGMQQMLVMLIIGIPLYVCASASTPIVAALALKGLSPGAALIFLLVGPATNATTITVVAQMMGKRIAVVYGSVIAAVALTLGLLTDILYNALAFDTTRWVSGHSHTLPPEVTTAAALILLACIFRARLLIRR